MNDNKKDTNKTDENSEEKYERALRKYLSKTEIESPKESRLQIIHEEDLKVPY